MHHLHTLPLVLDLASISVVLAWWAGIVPSIATTLTAIWVGGQIINAVYKWIKKKLND